MRIIKESFLAEAVPANSKAGKWLDAWRIVIKAAEWKNIAELRQTYPSADPVKVQSGRTVTVFNVCGNDYRLIAAIHYDRQRNLHPRIFDPRRIRQEQLEKEFMKTKQPMPFQSLPKDYGELWRMFLPRPIHDRAGYENTVEMADRFAGFEDQMTDDQNDFFDILCDLIERYDQDSAPTPKVEAAALLRHLAIEHDLTGADISRILGKSSPLGRMILRGERKITVAHAMCLGKHFGVRADAFFS